ncbi:hypothetical protein C8R47DRAFT_1068865 [Mycena vitilis]|nr:hypothetical protein C8R47DRAFT_1068865 [Mycena vitilis]
MLTIDGKMIFDQRNIANAEALANSLIISQRVAGRHCNNGAGKKSQMRGSLGVAKCKKLDAPAPALYSDKRTVPFRNWLQKHGIRDVAEAKLEQKVLREENAGSVVGTLRQVDSGVCVQTMVGRACESSMGVTAKIKITRTQNHRYETADGFCGTVLLGVLAYCEWKDILALQRVSRGMREHVLLLFVAHYNRLADRYFPDFPDDFSAALVASQGAITGSSGYIIALPKIGRTRTNMNVVVPFGHTTWLHALLARLNWVGWAAAVNEYWAPTALSHTIFQKSVAGDILTITLTETKLPSIIPHILRAKHSLAMTLLTPNSVTFLHFPAYSTSVRCVDGVGVLLHRLNARGIRPVLMFDGGEKVLRPRLVTGLLWATTPRWSPLRDIYADDLLKMFLGLKYRT